MGLFATFVIFGLASGALTSLVALGVVVVYRSSGVVNFSASAMGAVGAYVTYKLRADHSVPAVLALVAGLGVGGAMGLLTHFAMSFVRHASQLARIIVTLGLFTSVQAFILIAWGANTTVPASFFPTHQMRLAASIVITEDRLFLIVLAACLAAGLALFYSRTLFGLATSAVAENRFFAAGSGWVTNQIEMANQIVAGVLSAGAAILLAPIVGLNGSILAAVILPALAAALVGRFDSFILTVAASLGIGVAESEVSLYERDIAHWIHVSALSLSGLPEAVPLLIIIGLTVARGRSRLQRGETQAVLPLPGDGRISALPFGLALVAAVVMLVRAPSWSDALVAFSAWALLLLSIVVLTGYAGQLSLCQFALGGFGGWAAARITGWIHLPFLVSLLVGVLAATVIGLAVALPAMRARGVDLAIATLALALLLNALVFTNSSLTGGYDGITVPTPQLFGFNLDPIAHPNRYAAFGLVLVCLCGFLVANLRRGAAGRRLLAVRSDERAASSLGVSVYEAKLFAFAIASAIAGLAGTYLAFQFPSAQFTGYDASPSLAVTQNAVLGGLGWASGVMVGAMASAGSVLSHATNVALPTVHNVDAWLALFTVVLLLLVLRRSPDGIASVWARALNSPESERDRVQLGLSTRLWRTWGLWEIIAASFLLVGVVLHRFLVIGAVMVIAIAIAEVALRFLHGGGTRGLLATTALLAMAISLLAVGQAQSTRAQVYLFVVGQILGLRVVTTGLAKLSGRFISVLRVPKTRVGQSSDGEPPSQPISLQVSDLSVRFGGVKALEAVSFKVNPGEIVGLIGPNGAGKTTLLDVVTGYTRPQSGHVSIENGIEIDTWPDSRRARAGIVRSWQGVDLFDSMTVRENLLVAADPKRTQRYALDFFHPGDQVMTNTLEEMVRRFGLGPYMELKPGSLPQGFRRLIGIARALAASPRLLLLDEPAAGLDQTESAELAKVIRDVRDRLGIGMLIVEHDIPMLLGMCDRLIVLDFGRVVAEGPPADVQRDPLVAKAYLGDSPIEAGLAESSSGML